MSNVILKGKAHVGRLCVAPAFSILLAAASPILASANSSVVLPTQNPVTTTGTAWLDTASWWANGKKPSDSTVGDCDYVLRNLNGKYVGSNGASSTYTFNCHSFTFGATDSQAAFASNNGHQNFLNEGSIWVNCILYHWGLNPCTIAGTMTITNLVASSPALDIRTDSDLTFNFTGNVRSPAGAVMRIRYQDNPKPPNHNRVNISGSLSEYNGAIEVWNCGQLALSGAVSTMPGTIRLMSSSKPADTPVLELCTPASGAFTVSSAEFVAGSVVKTVIDLTSSKVQTLVIANSATLPSSGTVTVELVNEIRDFATPSAAHDFPLIQFPKGTANLSESRFDLVLPTTYLPRSYSLSVKDDAEGFPTLFLQRRGVVVANGTTNDMTLKTTWSDGLDPHDDCEYVSGGDAKQMLNGHQEKGGRFQPDLEIYDVTETSGWTYLVMNGLDSTYATIDNLYIRGNAGAQGPIIFCNWGGASSDDSHPFAESGTRTFKGKVHLLSGEFRYTTTSALYLRMEADIDGTDGSLAIAPQHEGGTTPVTAPFWAELAGANTFPGQLRLTANNATSFDQTVTLCFSGAQNLGGNPAAFVADALKIQKYTTFKALSTATLDTMNRGIAIAESRIETPEDVTLTIKQTINYQGAVHKRGAGILALAGQHTIDAANANPTIAVEEGGLQAGAADACQGLTLVFSGAAGLAPSVNAKGDALTKGFVLDKPVVLNTTDGKLHVRVVGDAGEATSMTTAILTVPANQAADIRSKLVVKGPKHLNAVEIVETTCEEGVTFTAKCSKGGLLLVVR